MSVSTIGVIGAGVMGSGIAQVAATKGIDVICSTSARRLSKPFRCRAPSQRRGHQRQANAC